MEGLRGLAALLVFFVHFRALFGGYFDPRSALGSAVEVAGAFGHTGVDLFFLLSGFLIYGIVFQAWAGYANYLHRRLKRLYPVFLVVLALYVALSLVFPDSSRLPPSPPAAFVYVLANVLMLPGMTSIVPLITVAWSLSYEFFFYVTIPLVVGGLALRRWRSWQRILLFLVVSAAQVYLCNIRVSNHVRLIMFASGITLWELVSFYSLSARLKAWGEYAAIAAFSLNLAWIGFSVAKSGPESIVLAMVPTLYAPTLFVTALALTAYALFFDGVLKRFFSWDYLRWMGNISYSYYLTHGLTLHGVRLVVNALIRPTPQSPLFGLALMLVCLIATLVCAAVLFVFIEKPLSLPAARASRTPVAVTG